MFIGVPPLSVVMACSADRRLGHPNPIQPGGMPGIFEIEKNRKTSSGSRLGVRYNFCLPGPDPICAKLVLHMIEITPFTPRSSILIKVRIQRRNAEIEPECCGNGS